MGALKTAAVWGFKAAVVAGRILAAPGGCACHCHDECEDCGCSHDNCDEYEEEDE